MFLGLSMIEQVWRLEQNSAAEFQVPKENQHLESRLKIAGVVEKRETEPYVQNQGLRWTFRPKSFMLQYLEVKLIVE